MIIIRAGPMFVWLEKFSLSIRAIRILYASFIPAVHSSTPYRLISSDTSLSVDTRRSNETAMSSSVSDFAMILASDLQQSHIIFTLQVGMHVSHPVGNSHDD